MNSRNLYTLKKNVCKEKQRKKKIVKACEKEFMIKLFMCQ